MMKAISEQVMRNEFNFFRELEEKQLEEELEEGTEGEEDDGEEGHSGAGVDSDLDEANTDI
jgi:hypothetical protein